MNERLEKLRIYLAGTFPVEEENDMLLVTVTNATGLVNVFTVTANAEGYEIMSRDGTSLAHYNDAALVREYLERFGAFPEA